MRLHRLEVEGFGPFRSRQSVDFDAFADDGIFLIGGRTGAGKSSILDAVCFGLYGGVPRYEGGEKRLRSDHCEPDDLTEVVVDFSTPAGRFRVTRSPEYMRPAKRGGGMTKQAAAVSLDERTEAGWVGRAARAVDVANELDDILQLSREQFLQVILLAQNRFSEFLLAGSKDRQALLRRLFGTQRFEDVQARFDDRRRAAEQALGARLATVAARVEEAERLVITADLRREGEEGDESPTAASAAPPSISERLERLQRARARADYRAERGAEQRTRAEEASAAADAALTSAREEQRAQAERDRARVALDRLEAEETQIAEARTELAAARAAEALRSTIAAAARARVALDAARESEQSARQAWALLEIDAGDDLESWTAERTRETGGWQHALELERHADELDAEVGAAHEAVEAASARVAAGESERAALPAEVADLRGERDEARRAADRASDLLTAREAAEARLRAAGEAERLRAAYVSAEQEVAAATTAHAAAQTELARLRQRRIEGMAGELAADLVDHQPCPVCGSLEHPQPATHSDPVSADDVAAAEATRDIAAADERDAAAKASAVRVELAAAETRADGRSIEQAEAEHAAAGEEYLRSVAAADRQKELDARLEELAEREERLDRERTDDAAALAAARESAAVLIQRQVQARAQIVEARGPFETVAERLAATEIQMAAARALLDAVAERERRMRAAVEAERDQAAQLARSSFDDVGSVEQALRPLSVQESLDAQVSRHAVLREKERAILFDLELRTLPEEPIDVAPAEEASAAARVAWVRAVDEASEASGIAERLSGLIESAAEEHARTAEDAAEFEVLRNLADTIAGRGANARKMTLETFVLAAELEEIVEAANRRLLDMSTGRYQLQHSDALAARGAASGLGIVVFDAFTGQPRPPQSLSGGETFLTSLALALGLAEVVTARAGGIRLDTLFIDEGFGSLDGDTLDVAMRTLDELRQGGRTVGVISHVEAMQEQIPAQLTVRALPNGPSVIETR